MTKLKVAAFVTLAVLLSGCGSSDSDTTENNDNSINPTNPNPPINQELPEPTPLSSLWSLPRDQAEGPQPMMTSIFSQVVSYIGPVPGAEVCLDKTGNFECDTDIEITNESGAFSMRVEAPVLQKDYFFIARFPLSELNHGRNSAQVFTDGDQVTLISRGFNTAVTPLTTLEALEYNPELPDLLQTERYAISRIMINNLFDLPGNVNIDKALSWAKNNGLTDSDIAEVYDEVFTRYQAALAEVNSPYQALHLANSVAAIEEFELAAKWYGYATGDEPLTASQAAEAQRALENHDKPVHMEVERSQIDIYNEISGRHITAVGNSNGYSTFERSASGYNDSAAMLCWNESQADWVSTESGLSNQSAPKAIGQNRYEFTNPATGVASYSVFTPLYERSPSYTTALHGWDKALDFSMGQVDGALIRNRLEAGDELCLSEGSQTATQSARLSTMTASELFKLMNPEGLTILTNSALQRIQVNSNLIVEYRILKTDDVEVLLAFPVVSNPSNAHISAWIWRDGEYTRTLYLANDRLNAITGESSHFILSDPAAVDITGQIRARR